MKIGTLVKTTEPMPIIGEGLGIVVEAYDSSKGLWYVYWLSGMGIGTTGLCNACAVEVLCK